MYMWGYLCTCVNAYGGWKRALDLLELESQEVLESPSFGARD